MKLVLLSTSDTLGITRMGSVCDTGKHVFFGILLSRTRFSILIYDGKSWKVLIDIPSDLRNSYQRLARLGSIQ